MLFNSFQFALFLPLVVLACFVTPARWRWMVLLMASYAFYACWRWQYVFLLGGQTVLNYGAALAVAGSCRERCRKVWVAVAVAGSLAALGYFKYLGFVTIMAADLARVLGAEVHWTVPRIVLPVGISFYTFQALSYTIDVYRRKVDAERNLARVALYVAFFPQLVAGPIERATHLLAQFRRSTHLDPERLASGVQLITWGLFKKAVIADRLAVYVDAVYGAPGAHTGGTLWVATYAFAFQIYGDFSGYSDIAIGAARILGYDLMANFKRPYLACSITAFWRRWHISLSSWFRDYVYLPLGGSRVSGARWLFNIAAVFLLSGLWHGAGWTFVAWGAMHGVYYVLERTLGRRLARLQTRLRIPRVLQTAVGVVLTFHAVLLAWVFFRAPAMAEATLILQRMLTGHGAGVYAGASQFTSVLSLMLVLFLVLVEVLQQQEIRIRSIAREPVRIGLRFVWMLGLVLGIAMFGMGRHAFVYFQF